MRVNAIRWICRADVVDGLLASVADEEKERSRTTLNSEDLEVRS